MKNIIFTVIITSFFASVSYADTFPVPLITSSTAQVVDAGFAVNGFQAYQDAIFEQDAIFKRLWRGVIEDGIENIFIGRPAFSGKSKIVTDSTINGQLTTVKYVTVTELSGTGTRKLCADTANGGKVIVCPPDICYGGTIDKKASGTYTLSFSGCPAIDITMKVWGAGGGGGAGQWSTDSKGNAKGGGGGGAGGYSYRKVLIPANATVTYVVGVGGNGGATDTGGAGKWGKNGTASTSTVGVYMVEGGGGLGGWDGWGSVSIPAGSGGSGGTSTGGTVNTKGTKGGDAPGHDCKGDPGGVGANTWNLDGSAVIANTGGSGAPAECTSNNDGKIGSNARDFSAGGGGGGGANPDAIGDNNGGAGGKGGNGRVQIFW